MFIWGRGRGRGRGMHFCSLDKFFVEFLTRQIPAHKRLRRLTNYHSSWPLQDHSIATRRRQFVLPIYLPSPHTQPSRHAHLLLAFRRFTNKIFLVSSSLMKGQAMKKVFLLPSTASATSRGLTRHPQSMPNRSSRAATV